MITEFAKSNQGNLMRKLVKDLKIGWNRTKGKRMNMALQYHTYRRELTQRASDGKGTKSEEILFTYCNCEEASFHIANFSQTRFR